ncbi:MAG: universal stress protein [Planctomycetota bacterium]
MIKRILVGLGSLVYAHSATAKALQLAKSHDAELTGVTLFDTESLKQVGAVPIGAGHLAKELKESRLDDVSGVIAAAEVHFAMACEKAEVPYRLRRETGNPLESLVALMRYHDLMVCGLESLIQHGVVDDPPDELAMLVRGGVYPLLALGDTNPPIERILVCYSGSMESAKTMRRFVQLRLWPDAQIKIATFGTRKPEPERLLADAADYFRAHGYHTDIAHIVDIPKTSILPYAETWGADLIVLGNSTKKMLFRRLLGETALYVMRNAEIPLFLAQ